MGLAYSILYWLHDYSFDLRAPPLASGNRRLLQRTHRPDTGEIFTTIIKNWRLIAAGTLLVAMTTTTFYFITVYTPTYGRAVLHLSARDSLIVTMLVGISNFIWLPIGGAISDRIGRRPVLMGITILALITTAGYALAHRRARFHAHDDGPALVLVLFWYVQRGNGRRTHRGDACLCAYGGLFTGIQSCHGDFWRPYSSHLHSAGPANRG